MPTSPQQRSLRPARAGDLLEPDALQIRGLFLRLVEAAGRLARRA
jgi:hypothetical protein